MAQVRVLGGSIGIAASSAILAVHQKDQLAGIVPPQALAMGTSAGLTDFQAAAVRRAFADAFTEDMKVCAAVAGVGLLIAFGTYRRKPLTIKATREAQVEEEKERRRVSRSPIFESE